MTKRTSAEVVNATLLEVFLAFVFVVLSIAWFEHSTSARETSRADSLATAQAGFVRQRDSARDALVRSPYAPPCHLGAVPKFFAMLTLARSGLIDVRVDRTELRHAAGEHFAVSIKDLPDSFNDLRQFSRDSTCHFLAMVRDATVSKDDYKRGLKAVRDIFYTTGELR